MRFNTKILLFFLVILICFGAFCVLNLMRVNDSASLRSTESKLLTKESSKENSDVTDTESTTKVVQIDVDDISDCPTEGSARMQNLQQLNRLKNRSKALGEDEIDRNVTLTKMLEPGDDYERWSINKGAEIIGYVADIKIGGVETCNCKANDPNHRDTHIELVLNPMNFVNNQKVIVEITPRMRKVMAARGIDWSTRALRDRFLGRWVKVKGWMLFDFEHSHQAENTNPGNARNWRATSWEIHPITSIEITDNAN